MATMRVPGRVSKSKQGYNMSWMLHQAKVCVRERNRTRAKHLFRALQQERGFVPQAPKP